MSRLFAARAFVAVFVMFTAVQPGSSVTIRHDVADSVYTDLAADDKYESAALLNLGTTCAVAGGVVIHPEWALTAAHCTPNNLTSTVNFNLGASNTDLDLTIAADNWFRHPSYTGDVGAGVDFGLVHLTEPVLDVTPIRLYRGTAELGNTATVVGYGRTGTGQTGDTLARGTRRAGQFNLDAFGGAVGASVKVVLSDFDNPNNPSQSSLGPTTALPLEAGIALNDSGSPWFIDINGLTFAAAITSFEASSDGNANSDYGDVGGATRISREITWIEANHDLTLFWNGTAGDWSSDFRWVTHPKPTAVNAAVIDVGEATISTAGETAKYVFVDGTGRLNIGSSLATSDIVVKRQGTLSPIGSVNQTSDIRMVSGTLEFELGTADQFIVTGDVEVAGELSIKAGSYSDPTARGTVEQFTLLVASDLQGSFDDIDYDGTSLNPSTNYVGTSSNGDDGMFRIIEFDQNNSNEIVLTNYLALPGDANGDLIVDGLDFIIWNDHKFTNGNDWSTGDFNGDGTTDGLDFILWNEFKFTSANIASGIPVSVPEPVGAAMLLAGLFGLATFRRRSR